MKFNSEGFCRYRSLGLASRAVRLQYVRLQLNDRAVLDTITLSSVVENQLHDTVAAPVFLHVLQAPFQGEEPLPLIFLLKP